MSRAISAAKGAFANLSRSAQTRVLHSIASKGRSAKYSDCIDSLPEKGKFDAMSKGDFFSLKTFAERGDIVAVKELLAKVPSKISEVLTHDGYAIIYPFAAKGNFEAIIKNIFPYFKDAKEVKSFVAFDNFKLLTLCASHNQFNHLDIFLGYFLPEEIKGVLKNKSLNLYQLILIFAENNNFAAVHDLLYYLPEKDHEYALTREDNKIIKIFAKAGNIEAVTVILSYMSKDDATNVLKEHSYEIIRNFIDSYELFDPIERPRSRASSSPKDNDSPRKTATNPENTSLEKLQIDAIDSLLKLLSNDEKIEAILADNKHLLEYFFTTKKFAAFEKFLSYLPEEMQKTIIMDHNCEVLRKIVINDDYKAFISIFQILDKAEQIVAIESESYSIIRNFAAHNNFAEVEDLISKLDKANQAKPILAKEFAILRNFGYHNNWDAVKILISMLDGEDQAVAYACLEHCCEPMIITATHEPIKFTTELAGDVEIGLEG